MIFNVYAGEGDALFVTPRCAPHPQHLAPFATLTHMGYAEVAFCHLSDELASSIADHGFGDVEAADDVQVRASMWGRRS